MGLPSDSGYYTCHPERLSEKGGSLRAFGRLVKDPRGFTRLDVGEESDEDLEKGAGSEREAKVTPVGEDGDDAAYGMKARVERRGVDAGLMEAEEKIWGQVVTMEGDDMELSVSMAEDIWHLLTVDLNTSTLLLLEVFLEIAMILFFGVLLTIVALIEVSSPGVPGGQVFVSKLLLALTSVRLSTDSIFGWQAHDASTGLEVAILAFQGWFHWLLLSVAGAVIVARALKPLRQVIFGPDCTLSDGEVSIRMSIIRFQTVTLYNMSINMQVTAMGGRTWELKLPNGLNGYARWTGGMPLTIRHIIDKDSPLHPENPAGIDMNRLMYIRVCLTATDNHGGPVYAAMCYYHPKGFFANINGFQKAFDAAGYLYPRILVDHKFKDQMRIFRDDEGVPLKSESLPHLICNLSNFGRSTHAPPPPPPPPSPPPQKEEEEEEEDEEKKEEES